MKTQHLIPLSIIGAGLLIGAMTATAIFFALRDSGGGSSTAAIQTEDFAFRDLTDEDHVLGKRDADIVVINYSDLECPYCKSHHPTLFSVYSQNSENVAIAYRHMPFKAQSTTEAVASECVARVAGEGAFWDFIDYIYSITPSNDGLDLDMLPTFAQEIGVEDIDGFNTCLNNEETLAKVIQERDDSSLSSIGGTPTTIITTTKAITRKQRNQLNKELDDRIIDYITISKDSKKLKLSGALPAATFNTVIGILN